jgi:pyridinium-3,5-biscarboxylic acid mononucleotide sulfurtransferase
MDPALPTKREKLVEILRGLDRVVVGFSGGVDSTFLGWAAARALGDRARLVTADSETYPAAELAESPAAGGAHRLAPCHGGH